MKRRTAIGYALGGVASVVLIPVLNIFSNRNRHVSDIVEASGEPVILSLITDDREILEIGRTIHLASAEKTHGEQLISKVLEGIPDECYNPHLNEPELKLHISKKIQEEFKNDKHRW